MPAQRRSTLVALTSEQEAFLKPPDAAVIRVEALDSQAIEPPPSRPPTRGTANLKRRGGNVGVRNAAHGPQTLQSVTLRLSTKVVKLLRRAAAERGLDYVEPFSQQAIAESALREWLSGHGYPIE